MIFDAMVVVNRSLEEFQAVFFREYDRLGLAADLAAALLIANDARQRYNEAERFARGCRGRRAAYGWAIAVVHARRLAYNRAIRKHFEAVEALGKITPHYYNE